MVSVEVVKCVPVPISKLMGKTEIPGASQVTSPNKKSTHVVSGDLRTEATEVPHAIWSNGLVKHISVPFAIFVM